MEINDYQVMLCAKTVEYLYEMSKMNEEIDEEKIRKMIDIAITLSNYKYNELELVKVKEEVEYRCQIKHQEGSSISDDYNHYDWYTERVKSGNIDSFFWNRYRDYLLEKQDLGLNIVNKLDNSTLIELMNYLGDPKSQSDFLRRGLIIGDVQSGKTSTYIGLVCKAVDAGYKVVILLTGTIETLRNQTQKRVEEGFVGFDISQCVNGAQDSRIGVGLDGKPLYVTAMTSRDYDFVGNVNRITTSLESNKVVLFVIKKNTTVLNKLINWLVSLNADSLGKIDYPMLLIDDESDNASVNTNKPEEDPTKINGLIRSLVDVFRKSTYVGFTATPFANVFINPETTEDMENHDLFPENFIYCLPIPNTYIGAQKIFYKDGKYNNSLRYIKDAGVIDKGDNSFYYKHKKDWRGKLPSSLTDAIYVFLLSNAIRDLRKDNNKPRTMMINISRFVDVQQYVKSCVEKIYENIYVKIKYDLSKDNYQNIPELNRIYNLWVDNFKELEFTWEEVTVVLFKSIELIEIKVVNSSKGSDKLDYEHNPNLRAIAIGGLALSRGLTLEGLIVSYFYRNTSTYDVLMQMGRWFGYRKNYVDLFRIWTSKKSADWYLEISEATELLRDDVSLMREYKKTPKDFGLRVRNDSTELRITAANKMRNASDKIELLNYFGDVFETPYLINDIIVNQKNLQNVIDIVSKSTISGIKFIRQNSKGKHYALKNVPKNLIVNFINEYKSSRYNQRFDTNQIFQFLVSCSDNSIDYWDIVFMEGTKNQEPFEIEGEKIYPIVRDFSNEEYLGRISIGNRGKLAGTSDGLQCLDDQDIINKAKYLFEMNYLKEKGYPWNSGKKKNYPVNTWFKYVESGSRRPLMIIYLINLITEELGPAEKKLLDDYNGPWVGVAIGLPNKTGSNVEIHKYKVNPIYTKNEIDDMINELEEE